MEPDAQQAAILAAKGFEVYTSLEHIPDAAFDWVYAFNVLEHIADDKRALVEWAAKLIHTQERKGRLLIYVPAFGILFSSMDRQVGHFRRYRRKELSVKIQQAGLIPLVSRYADSLGFWAALLYKLIDKSGSINRRNLIFYDRFCFPLSRIGDMFSGKLFGKNIVVIAGKAPVSQTINKIL
jgi:SAM-dependent methyltransferase